MKSYDARPAVSSDTEDVRSLCLAARGPNDRFLPLLASWFASEEMFSLVATEQDRVVGYAVARRLPEHAWVMGMRVKRGPEAEKIRRDLLEAARRTAAPLPLCEAVFGSDAATLQLYREAGFRIGPGFTVMGTLSGVRALGLPQPGVVETASPSDASAVRVFLHSRFNFSLEATRFYGEDFVLHALDPDRELPALSASGRLLLARSSRRELEGVAIVGPEEIGRIWGNPAPFVTHCARLAKEGRLLWYCFDEAEKTLARRGGFGPPEVPVDFGSGKERLEFLLATSP